MEITPEYVLKIMQSKLDGMQSMTDGGSVEDNCMLTGYGMALKDCAEYFGYDRENYGTK